MLAEIEGILTDRERYFRANRIDSIATYRQGRAQGRFDDGYGDVFLVVDGWGSLRADLDDVDMRIQKMMARALTYGVHLVVSTQRWNDMRQQIQDIVSTRLEMHLGDAGESCFGRKVAEAVPQERPGRGVGAGGHQILVALPRADGDHDPDTLGQGVRTTLERIAQAAPAGLGPRLRLLPERVTLEEEIGRAHV